MIAVSFLEALLGPDESLEVRRRRESSLFL